MKRAVLTEEGVLAAKSGILWDSVAHGLGVRCFKKTKSYIFRKKGSSNAITIGECSKVTLIDARALVLTRSKSGKMVVNNFAMLCHEWVENWASFKRRTVREDMRRINKYLIPNFGDKKPIEITKREVHLAFNRWTLKGSIEANRCLHLARAIFNKAIEWDLVDTKNPFTGIAKNYEPGRSRVATNDELDRLLMAIRAEGHIGSLFLLCLFCGLRRGEAMGLCWRNLNINEGVGIVKGTKNGKDFTFHFGEELKTRLKKGKNKTQYVFANQNGERRRCVKKDWARICNNAEVSGLTIHDLRRTFATRLLEQGVPIGHISKAMNHSSIAVTQKYLHMSEEVKKGVFEIADNIFASTNRKSMSS